MRRAALICGLMLPTGCKTSDDSHQFVPSAGGSQGSGIVVSRDGYVVTAFHVIDGCRRVFVARDGMLKPAQVVSRNRREDLALLQSEFQSPAAAVLAAAAPLEGGGSVMAVGYPASPGQPFSIFTARPKMRRGHLSDVHGYRLPLARDLPRDVMEILTIPAIAPGMSGGPVLNNKGAVIGMITARLTMFGNTSYAVPVGSIRGLLRNVDLNAGLGGAESGQKGGKVNVRDTLVAVVCQYT